MSPWPALKQFLLYMQPFFFFNIQHLDLPNTSHLKKAVWVGAMSLLMPPEFFISDLTCCEISTVADFIIVRVP